MSKRGWAAVIVGGPALLLLAFFLAGGVYRTVNVGGGRAYLVNRFTGKTVVLRPTVAALPARERAQLEGRAGLRDYRRIDAAGSFSVSIYNGSSWTVKEITVEIRGMSLDESEVIERTYRIPCDVDSLTRGDCYATVDVVPLLDSPASGFAWHIVGARGIPGG